MALTRDEMAGMIDHTNLHGEATRDDIETLCEEADRYGFAAVCLYPADIPIAHRYREDHDAAYDICTVIGFPHGKDTLDMKAYAAQDAVEHGASEVDMVINQRYIIDGDYEAAVNEVRAVRDAVPGTLKTILETCNLDPDEIQTASRAAIEGGADFLKTSTGFGDYGADPDDIAIMAETIREEDASVGIKAAGGIKTAADVETLLDAAGMDPDPASFRVGSSSGTDIVDSMGE